MSEQPQVQVTYDVSDGVATITLDSPHNRNALSRALVGGLFEALERAAEDDSARVVVIAATGSVFCSGADLSEAAAGSMEEGAREIVRLQRVILMHPKPVVCRLQGPVRAGGTGIVAAADVVVASETATFALTGDSMATFDAAGFTSRLATLATVTTNDVELRITQQTVEARVWLPNTASGAWSERSLDGAGLAQLLGASVPYLEEKLHIALAAQPAVSHATYMLLPPPPRSES